MRRDPRVLVAPCRPDGKLRREAIAARVDVLTDTPDLERVQKLLRNRYKISYRLVMLVYRLGRRLRGRPSVADGAALAITVDERCRSRTTIEETDDQGGAPCPPRTSSTDKRDGRRS